jgi:hypothetical protein
MATLKQRRGPTASATLFPVGTKRTGNDGNQWMVEANKNGVHRWVLVKRNVKKTVKASKVSKAKKSYTSSFDLCYKQSKQCQGQEEGSCNPFMKSELVEDLMWNMGFSNDPGPSMPQYDTCIGFWGPPEYAIAAKDVVRREYTKLKERGVISKFTIEDTKV